MTPGYKTTEFYLTLLVHLLTFFTASGILPSTHWAIKVAAFVMSALAQAGYTYGRSLVKSADQSEPAAK